MAYLIALIMIMVGTAPAYADPFTVGAWVLTALGTGGFYGATAIVVGQIVIGALAIGGLYAANTLLSGGQSEYKPSDRQVTLRQSNGPRFRYYGRVKVGGTVWFYESKDGWLYRAIIVNEGQISSFIEYWLNDQRVYLNSSGEVITSPYVFGLRSIHVAMLLTKNGASSQTAFSPLVSAFSQITANHRNRGSAQILGMFKEVDSAAIGRVYPQGEPNIRVVIDSSIVKNVRTGVRGYSQNLADAIYDYLTGRDDAGFPYGAGFLESQINLASFQDYANVAAQAVPLKAGGSEPRYRISGGFGMNERMRDVLGRMLRVGDASLYMDTQGRIAIRGGRWVAPQLFIDGREGHIMSAQFVRGTGMLAAFNELTVMYMDPRLDYQESEAQKWIDTSNVALRGRVIPEQIDITMCPSHGQARRLAKIHTHKSNPAWSGTIVTNFYGFNAIGEENVRIRFDPLGIDTTFMINSVRILDDLTGVELSVSSLTSSAYAWDAALEEGTASGLPPDTSTPPDLSPPANFTVTAGHRLIGDTTSTILLATWTPPSRTSLVQQVEYRTSPNGTWTPMLVSDGQPLAESGIVTPAVSYDVRIRTMSPGGSAGEWIDPVVTVAATADTSPPAAVSGIIASVTGSDVQLAWTMPSSANAIGANIYRNTTNNFGTATLIAGVYRPPSTLGEYTDIGLSAGTYYYWIVSFNGSNFIEGPEVATGAQVVS